MTIDDGTMSLGDHLDELRRRLVRIILVVFAVMIIAMFFSAEILQVVLHPLERAAQLVDEEALVQLQVESRDELTVLHNKNLTEGPVSVIRIAFYTALVVAVPMILIELWGFVTPGLTRDERRFAFMLLPLAAIFFYAGLVFGYFIGLPYLYEMIIEFNAAFNTGVKYTIFQADYYSFFFLMCVLFGFLLDVPWAVMLLVRTGVVTPDQLAAKRKLIYFVAIVCAAIFTPPDPYSQVMIWGMAALLFEAGLLASRFLFKAVERDLEPMAAEDDDPAEIARMATAHDDHDADHDDLDDDHDHYHDDHDHDHDEHPHDRDDDDDPHGPVSRRTGWDGPPEDH